MADDVDLEGLPEQAVEGLKRLQRMRLRFLEIETELAKAASELENAERTNAFSVNNNEGSAEKLEKRVSSLSEAKDSAQEEILEFERKLQNDFGLSKETIVAVQLMKGQIGEKENGSRQASKN